MLACGWLTPLCSLLVATQALKMSFLFQISTYFLIIGSALALPIRWKMCKDNCSILLYGVFATHGGWGGCEQEANEAWVQFL